MRNISAAASVDRPASRQQQRVDKIDRDRQDVLECNDDGDREQRTFLDAIDEIGRFFHGAWHLRLMAQRKETVLALTER